MAKIDTFDLDYARNADADTAADMVRTMATAWRAQAKRDGSLVIAAAYTMVAAMRNKITNASVAEAWGKTTSTVTLYRRLALAVDDCGVEVGSDDWKFLSGKAGANIAYVARVIEGKPVDDIEKEEKGETVPANAERLAWILSHARKPDGSKVPAKEIENSLARERNLPEPNATTDNSGGDGSGGTGSQENLFSTRATFAAAVATIAKHAEDLSTDEWANLQDALGQMSKALKAKAAFERKQANGDEKVPA